MSNITKTLTSHVSKKLESVVEETNELFDSLQDVDGSAMYHIMEYEDEIKNLSDKLDKLRFKLNKKIQIGPNEIKRNRDYIERMKILEKMYPLMLYSLVHSNVNTNEM